MKSLVIDNSAVELSIDNDPKRIIRFYPTDVSFAENFFTLAREFDERQKQIDRRLDEIEKSDCTQCEKLQQGIALSREAFEILRTGIDKVFGSGTSNTVFGEHNNLDMVARFFRGVTPYIKKARQSEIDKYLKDIGGDVLE